MKSCICTIVKNENKYLKEWIDYHLNLGFNKIIIFDNNSKNGETIDPEIIKNHQVYIIDDRGVIEYLHQVKIYYNFFSFNQQKLFYDWICFIDIDEFLTLDPKFKDINDFLSQSSFNGFEQILINCAYYTTDNPEYLFEYKEVPVLERFNLKSRFEGIHKVKSFVRKNINFTNIKGKYNVAHNIPTCDCSGNPIPNEIVTEKLNYNELWIKHIYGKSLEEFKDKKISKVYCDVGILYNNEKTESIIRNYFEINRHSKNIRRLKEELKQICIEQSVTNDFI